MVSRDAFGGFTFAEFSAKDILVVLVVMISPSLVETSMVFSNRNYSFICNFLHNHFVKSKANCLILWFYMLLLFLNLFFIWDLRRYLLIGKKSKNTYSLFINWKNTIDIGITRHSDSTDSRDDLAADSVGNIIACTTSIPKTTFCFII